MTLRFHHWILAIASAVLFQSAFVYMLFHARPQGTASPGTREIEISIGTVIAAIGEKNNQGESISEPPVIKEKATKAAPEEVVEAVEETLPIKERAKPPKPEDPPRVEEPTPQNVSSMVINAPLPQPRPQKLPPRPLEEQAKKIIKKPEATPETFPETLRETGPKPGIQKAETPKISPSEKKTPPKQQQKTASRSAVNTGTQANHGDQQVQSGEGRKIGRIDPNYGNTLRHWLEKHKTYPSRARRRRQEGVVIIAFTVNRQGKILDSEITKSSGYKILDSETVRMLKRAQPLPPFPEEMEGEKLEFSIPIQFFLR